MEFRSSADLARTPEDRLLIELIFGQQTLGRPFASTPGVPAERTNALRHAFAATMADPQFLADAAKAHAISPMSGEEVESFIARMTGAPAAVVERARAAVRND